MICIGGVCIPYSAIVPLVLMGIRWVFAKLHLVGILPSFVSNMMNLNQQRSPVVSKTVNLEKPPCRIDSAPFSNPSDLYALESEEQFYDLLKKDEKFVVKFTASWCKPCKNIYTFYQHKCAEYTDYKFVTVDVDDFDGIAGKYKVAMMPTFIVVQGNSILGTFRGSGESELDSFLRTHLR